MTDAFIENNVGRILHDSFIFVCRWIWEKRKWVWSANGFNLVVGIVGIWLFTSDATTSHAPIRFLLGYIPLILSLYGSSWGILLVAGLISLIPLSGANERFLAKKEEERYLKRIKEKHMYLAPNGIAALPYRVLLKKVFIDVDFVPSQPLSVYPLSEEELRRASNISGRGSPTAQERRYLKIVDELDRDFQKNIQKQRITLAKFWRELISEQPAVAVIQGGFGMGKSTQMKRLTLFMAQNSLQDLLNEPDTMSELEAFRPVSIPILLNLKEYAEEYHNSPNLGVEGFLRHRLEADYHIKNIDLFLQYTLKAGSCLVIFDGLDEISDTRLRHNVQTAIQSFIEEHCDTIDYKFNRFIITSRISGYEQRAFPTYRHYTIAELNDSQIEIFLDKWSKVREHHLPFDSDSWQHPGIRSLARNPLLLTHMALKEKPGIELPHNRVALYQEVTRLLLERRDTGEEFPKISEEEAIRCLGPLALEMQETSFKFISHADVIKTLKKAFEKPEEASVQQEDQAKHFLKRVNEQYGLFVQRLDEFYSFFQAPIQEYFVARHILNLIEFDRNYWIAKFVEMVRDDEMRWREPFILALAYRNGRDDTIANDLLQALFNASLTASPKEHKRDILLAAECLIGNDILFINVSLVKDIAHQILLMYQEAQQQQHFDMCVQIEELLRFCLVHLPGRSYGNLPLFEALCEACINRQDVALQFSTLTLLTMIAPHLHECPYYVFNELVPPLLGLTERTIELEETPKPNSLPPWNYNVADLALSSLTFLDSKGPAGLILPKIQAYFALNPSYLDQLALYSLECHTLLTPANVHETSSNYRDYKATYDKWVILNDSVSIKQEEERKKVCLEVQKTLLTCANEVCYPLAHLLYNMLQTLAKDQKQEWWLVLHDQLNAQLQSGPYMIYQETILLKILLFPFNNEEQRALADLIKNHYVSNDVTRRRFAQRFLATLTIDLRDLQGLKTKNTIETLREFRAPKYKRTLRYLADLRTFDVLLGSKAKVDLSYLRSALLEKDLVSQAIERLVLPFVPSIDEHEQDDLLTILLGRVLYLGIDKTNETGEDIEAEIQVIVEVAYSNIASGGNRVNREIVLDIVRNLPLRTANEIAHIQKLFDTAQNASDEELTKACITALAVARPLSTPALNALEKLGQGSKVADVQRVVDERIKKVKADLSLYR